MLEIELRCKEIDSYQELTDVFGEPRAKTVEPVVYWPRFWGLFGEAKNADCRLTNLDVAGWLLEHMAFGDDGVRMVAR